MDHDNFSFAWRPKQGTFQGEIYFTRARNSENQLLNYFILINYLGLVCFVTKNENPTKIIGAV